jgi:hypothetical protein
LATKGLVIDGTSSMPASGSSKAGGFDGVQNDAMKAHECYHCKQWVEKDEPHDCWTTTEAALTKDLPEDLQDAYRRLRETAVEFGEQRIYASHSSIMFARKACYFFVRPKRKFLEVCIFLGRAVKTPQIKKVVESSRVKRVHLIHVTHRDQVEPPLTDWLREAYEFEPVAKTIKPVAKKVVKNVIQRATRPQPKERAVERRTSAKRRR